MLYVKLDEENGIVVLEPHGELTIEDFKTASEVVNPYLVRHDKLKGVIIHVQSFPGWNSFSALVSHLKFVKEHHKKIKRVALVTDSMVADVAKSIVSHFVSAQIKNFAFDEFEVAKKWIQETT